MQNISDMAYKQRDIVEVNFLFADGQTKVHPAIIVSNDELQADEDGLIYMVLITSKMDINPQYGYPLKKGMCSCDFGKPSCVKCQIITGYTQRDVIRKFGVVKQPYFDEIVDKIIESIF